MKLIRILDDLGSLEKNSFIKIIDSIISEEPKNKKQIDKILNNSDGGLKSADSQIIFNIFKLVENEFIEIIKSEFVNTSSQLDILIDIISRDGNCIMKFDWFSRLYDSELKNLRKKINDLKSLLANDKADVEVSRLRDYDIYRSCLHVAYNNDSKRNREAKITDDELEILLTLANKLDLSQEEVKLFNYMIIGIVKMDINTIINSLKNIGVIFYAKKINTIFVAEEIVMILRKVRKKELADKYYRRTLRLLRESQINLVCKKHNIDRKLPLNEKIRKIINEGISFTALLGNEIFKEGTSLTERKKLINDVWNKGLNLKTGLKGTTVEDKISNFIRYFEEIEKEEKVGISTDGYEKLLSDLGNVLPKLSKELKSEFELQEDNVLNSKYLLDYNIKPRDILDLVSNKDLDFFCKKMEISVRGNEITNILDSYKDSENLYLENYENIGFRDLKALKENGIIIKESELGIKFEELTKSIFRKLGFNVDEDLRKKLNTKKDQMDIVLNLGNNELIIVECKTKKESGYNKFSSVSRQLKSYNNQVNSQNHKVIKSLLIAPEFSDEFINDCELEYDLNLSLIVASSLYQILNGFKSSKKHKQFPYKLLMRDVLIKEDRILKAILK